MRVKLSAAAVLGSLVVSMVTPTPAHAFCGFYVSGADEALVNDATMVVLMREGSRTVLSMQNHYQGPPEDFAMVVPVPTVLAEGDVKVLRDSVFRRVDRLAAPRLVEYWEQDPCGGISTIDDLLDQAIGGGGSVSRMYSGRTSRPSVTVEAEFTVGEYEVVILSARDSAGLDAWLRDNDYAIPRGAAAVLRPYVEAGMKFFVAKVDVAKVRFEDGQAKLSPIRFHYDSETFSLPVRLGLLNAEGKQDLIVHILARGQRYEVANYANATIPTNVDVAGEVRERFPQFYATLFDETLAQEGRAIITEYAWQATSCDPCPGPVLSRGDLMTLGADVLPGVVASPVGRRGFGRGLMSFVLTRLHTRYDRRMLTEDLVFRAAPPIVGGRELRDADGELEHGAMPSGQNNFQGRYAIRHEWEGPIKCEDPIRGRWGGRPSQPTRPATDTAFVGRGALRLAAAIRTDIPELEIAATPGAPLDIPPEERVAEASTEPVTEPPSPDPVGPPVAAGTGADGGCASCTAGTGTPTGAALALLLLLGSIRRR